MAVSSARSFERDLYDASVLSVLFAFGVGVLDLDAYPVLFGIAATLIALGVRVYRRRADR